MPSLYATKFTMYVYDDFLYIKVLREVYNDIIWYDTFYSYYPYHTLIQVNFLNDLIFYRRQNMKTVVNLFR